MAKTHYSCAELAAMKLPDLPGSVMGWSKLVKRDAWAFIEVACAGGKGGLRREYAPPERIAKLIVSRSQIQDSGAAARATSATIAAIRAEREAERNSKTAVAFDELWGQLSDQGHAKFDAKLAIVLAWRTFFAARQPLARNASFAAFAAEYNARRVTGLDEATLKAYGTISPRSIQRWVLDNETKGLVVMADNRTRKGGGTSTVEATPALEQLILHVLTEKPHANHTAVLDIINARRIDPDSGEILWPELSYSALNRYINKWKEQNAQIHLLNTNPDAWKSKYLSSLGRLDGDITRINQRWEMDGTPADWMLRGGRYTASVVIDVWSRRPKILFSKTARTETNKALMRAAVLEWGVPEQAKTDNGTDYVSREMLLFFEEMGIEGVQSAKFSPWEKAHVESFIKTYLHSLLELLDAFIGHSVAERSGIEARRTFAEQLFKKNAVVAVDLTVEELQTLTNAWIDGTYMVREHGTLGISPRERVASWTAPVRRIDNERALDILLWKPAKRNPVITAKGIRHDKADFIHPLLPLHAGKDADIRLDPNDLGRLVVRVDGKFLCIAECPERTGIDRATVAAKGRAVQQEWAKEERALARRRRREFPSTDALVKQIILDRAQESGKVALLPKRADSHDTPALRDAAMVAERLAGAFGEISPDAGVIVPAAIAAVPPAPTSKVSVIPETAELRWRKHADLAARFAAGEYIPEMEIEQVRDWLVSYPRSPEGQAMAKKYAPQMVTAKPALTGFAALIR